MKRLIAAFLASLTLLSLVGCGAAGSAGSAQPKDYAQIIHDARPAEDNEYQMIFTNGSDGKYTAIDGYSADYEADVLSDEIENLLLPGLGLEEGSYTDFAASLSMMMIRVYGIAIVKPAEGKTDAVKDALESFVLSQQQSMENYLADQYEIALNAKVKVVPTGEVVMVCCENSDTVLANIEKALAA